MISSARPRPHRGSLGLALLLLAMGATPFTLPSCAEDSAGIEVPVTYRAAALTGAPLESADGERVRLTAVRVGIDSLTLHACAEPVLAQATRLFMAGTARAHSAMSPLRIGTPVALDALGEVEQHPGTFRPTPGSYCGLHGMLAVPDADALGADPALPLDAAIQLEGERLSAEGEVLSTFALASTMSVSFERALDLPLELSAESPYAEITLVMDAAALIGAVSLPEGALDAAGASALSSAAAAALRVELVRFEP